MNRLLFLLVLCGILHSCGDKAKKPVRPDTGNNTADTPNTFLPVGDLLREDTRKVDSFAAGIVKKTEIDGKKDSSFVKLPEFHRLADKFLLKEFDSAYFQDHFREESLMDETTRMLHFIYTPKDTEPMLQRVVVYLEPSLADDNVERIYFETAYSKGDTVVEKKYTWKMGQYFYILTIQQPKSGKSITSLEKLIWDPQHFADE
jgi:hypothetical protein